MSQVKLSWGKVSLVLNENDFWTGEIPLLYNHLYILGYGHIAKSEFLDLSNSLVKTYELPDTEYLDDEQVIWDYADYLSEDVTGAPMIHFWGDEYDEDYSEVTFIERF